MKRKIGAALLSVAAAATTVLGLQSPAAAQTDPSYCVYAIYLPGGWGCFIRDGDNIVASDTKGDGNHVEVTWMVRHQGSSSYYEAGICSVGYGLTIACDYNFDKGDDIRFGVGIYHGSALVDDSGWSSWIDVGA
jgi:hypothetical protein